MLRLILDTTNTNGSGPSGSLSPSRQTRILSTFIQANSSNFITGYRCLLSFFFYLILHFLLYLIKIQLHLRQIQLNRSVNLRRKHPKTSNVAWRSEQQAKYFALLVGFTMFFVVATTTTTIYNKAGREGIKSCSLRPWDAVPGRFSDAQYLC